MEVSIHKPKTTKPDSVVNFGFFLAGLIDSDGHFSKIPQLVVCFHEKEFHIPYYLKKKLGYGIVSKVKNKKAVTFIMAHSLGLEKVCALVHNKLQHKEKIIQYNTRLRSLKNFAFTEKQTVFSIKQNLWFTGFFIGDGSFQIKILKRMDRKKAEVRVVIQIDQKTKCLLLQIKNAFGGSVLFRKSQNTFYYSSVNFASAKRIIQYFDTFHLMGIKMTQYTLWRKVFLKVQNKNFNRTELDYKWITKVKKRMSCC
jgi:hypothetical protein